MTTTQTTTGWPGQGLLAAAAARELVAVIEVVDRPHLVWNRAGEDVVEASGEQVRLVLGLLESGLAQLGEIELTVPWYGGQARGVRVLPTQKGLAVLDADDVATAFGQTWASYATWGGDPR